MTDMVAAGIVTHNPEIGRLHENIAAIAPQVACLYIYDNASGNLEEIETAIEGVGNETALIRADENEGMAIALNRLAHRALERGCSHIVFLDQDSIARPNLVTAELACAGDGVGIVAPLVIDRNEIEDTLCSGKVEFVPRAITSGALVDLGAFEAVGGYDERLFVDWVDFEFCANLRAHGYKILRTSATSILHELGHEEYVGRVPRRNPAGKLELRVYYRTNHALWRRRDKVRSQAITIEKYRGTVIGREELKVALKGFLRALAFERNRLGTIRAAFSGWAEGRRIAKQNPRIGA